MHNLYLGTCKHMLKLWISRGILQTSNFEHMQKIIDDVHTPPTIGRIPRKIETSFSGFTADQLKNWTNIYSIVALHSFVSGEDLECWRHFVLASRILCKKKVSQFDLNLADALLMQFCRRFERIYGKAAVTPNMHLHCHLKDVLADFGPVYSFWLFSFERYNGILGNQPTNNRAIEPQLMRRFVRDQSAFLITDEQNKLNFSSDFENFFPKCERVTGSVWESQQAFNFQCILPLKCTRQVLQKLHTEYLQSLFCKLYPLVTMESAVINMLYLQYRSVKVGSMEFFSSKGLHYLGGSVAMAKWNTNFYGNFPVTVPNKFEEKMYNSPPVKIHWFGKIFCCVGDSTYTETLVCVSWFKVHPQYSVFGKPVQVWCSNIFERPGVHSFLTIPQLVCPCVHSIQPHSSGPGLVVVPMIS